MLVVVLVNQSGTTRMKVFTARFSSMGQVGPLRQTPEAQFRERASSVSDAKTLLPETGYGSSISVRSKIGRSSPVAGSTLCLDCIKSQFRPGDQPVRDSDQCVEVCDEVVLVRLSVQLRSNWLFGIPSRTGRGRSRIWGRPLTRIVLGKTSLPFGYVTTSPE